MNNDSASLRGLIKPEDGFVSSRGFSTQLGLHELKATGSPPVGYSASLGNGHGASLVGPASRVPLYYGLPKELVPGLEQTLTNTVIF